ncbi:MAG: hypothetical protein WB341_03470 [Terracidiphilus sp.]
MKRWLPVLILVVGLGNSISSTQDQQQRSPFDRYLAGLRANQPEPAFVRFAGECGVDVRAVEPRYAQSPTEKWVLVKDLSNALKDQETDFYATVAVWHVAGRILIEEWGMELDTGTFSRQFVCLHNSRISFFEGVDWTIPVEGASSSNPAWGYQQRWRMGPAGRYEKIWSRFVDVHERPIKEPNLDADTRNGLDWKWAAYIWRDLKYPDELLR